MSLQGQGHFPRSSDSVAGDHDVGDYVNISSFILFWRLLKWPKSVIFYFSSHKQQQTDADDRNSNSR